MSDVRIIVDLSHPPEVVWTGLTRPELLSEWFMPVESQRAFPPPGMRGFTAPFDVELVEAVEPFRLRMLWRGDQMHSEVLWEVQATGSGSRLIATQTGFLGLSGDQRRAELVDVYGRLLRVNLPETLARLSPPVEPLPWWRRVLDIPVDRRLRLLSVVGAMILTVLIATALAMMLLSPPEAPAGIAAPSRGPAMATQPGVTPSPSPWPPRSPTSGPTASPALPTTAPPPPVVPDSRLTASYQTSERFQLGYIGSVTVKAGPDGLSVWQAVVELPPGATVTSAWDRMVHRQNGDTVTFTPGKAHQDLGPGVEYTFFFQVRDPSERDPVACSVNGVTCSGLNG